MDIALGFLRAFLQDKNIFKSVGKIIFLFFLQKYLEMSVEKFLLSQQISAESSRQILSLALSGLSRLQASSGA